MGSVILTVVVLTVLLFAVETLVRRRFGDDAVFAFRTLVDAALSVVLLGCALAAAVSGAMVQAVVYAAVGGYAGWRAWTDWNSRNRRRRASRVSSRVVDLGHKLAVEKA